jgi:hypothetical protein
VETGRGCAQCNQSPCPADGFRLPRQHLIGGFPWNCLSTSPRMRATIRRARIAELCGLVLLLFAPLSGQVVFSRRVYNEKGPSYQQIWNWNPSDGSMKQLTDSPRGHFLPVCAGQRILFASPEEWRDNAKRWSFDRTTRNEKLIGPVRREPDRRPAAKSCDVSAVVGLLKACGKRGELSISRGGKQTVSIHISGEDFPIEFLAWSPSRTWLLAGTLGANTSSTSPQSDLFALDVASMKLIKAGSGNDETWLPARDEFLYTSPRDMASLAGGHHPRKVWVEHLIVFNPASGKNTAITSGVTNNMQPRVCGK